MNRKTAHTLAIISGIGLASAVTYWLRVRRGAKLGCHCVQEWSDMVTKDDILEHIEDGYPCVVLSSTGEEMCPQALCAGVEHKWHWTRDGVVIEASPCNHQAQDPTRGDRLYPGFSVRTLASLLPATISVRNEHGEEFAAEHIVDSDWYRRTSGEILGTSVFMWVGQHDYPKYL